MFKPVLGLALIGLTLALAGCAAPVREAPLQVAQGYGVPTYGYAAQYYAPPRARCCGAPPCCVPPPAPPCGTCVGALTLGPEFAYDGGVGPIPEGGYSGGGYVIVGGGSGSGSGSGASARATATASASASSHVTVRIGGGGKGGHGKPGGCGGGCGH
ncbi:hypothetical protein [Phenylobacterium sp.]|jgi:hypothetical protein|uniref:hypothetical protein n=1 Tax=Phenylobacterium sp. TaxID=1871053 RepID=UPI0035AF7400